MPRKPADISWITGWGVIRLFSAGVILINLGCTQTKWNGRIIFEEPQSRDIIADSASLEVSHNDGGSRGSIKVPVVWSDRDSTVHYSITEKQLKRALNMDNLSSVDSLRIVYEHVADSRLVVSPGDMEISLLYSDTAFAMPWSRLETINCDSIDRVTGVPLDTSTSVYWIGVRWNATSRAIEPAAKSDSIVVTAYPTPFQTKLQCDTICCITKLEPCCFE